eukprot:4367909-Prymnesium_polylepis.1
MLIGLLWGDSARDSLPSVPSSIATADAESLSGRGPWLLGRSLWAARGGNVVVCTGCADGRSSKRETTLDSVPRVTSSIAMDDAVSFPVRSSRLLGRSARVAGCNDGRSSKRDWPATSIAFSTSSCMSVTVSSTTMATSRFRFASSPMPHETWSAASMIIGTCLKSIVVTKQPSKQELGKPPHTRDVHGKSDSIASSVIDSISTKLTARACSCTTIGVSCGFVCCSERATMMTPTTRVMQDGPAISTSAVYFKLCGLKYIDASAS